MIDLERIIKCVDWLVFERKVKSRRELAEKMGYTESSMSQILNNKVALSSKFVKKLSIIDNDINFNWLLTGEGEMLNNISEKPRVERGQKIIRYWTDIEATGNGNLIFNDNNTNKRIDLQIPEFKDCTDAINLYGDSMSPRYKSGQIIILKEWTENFIEYGNVYLIITKNGHRMVKQLKAIKDNIADVMCVSFNIDFDPFPINKEDIMELYMVKGAIEKTTL